VTPLETRFFRYRILPSGFGYAVRDTYFDYDLSWHPHRALAEVEWRRVVNTRGR
jgi:hypothetical protein